MIRFVIIMLLIFSVLLLHILRTRDCAMMYSFLYSLLVLVLLKLVYMIYNFIKNKSLCDITKQIYC